MTVTCACDRWITSESLLIANRGVNWTHTNTESCCDFEGTIQAHRDVTRRFPPASESKSESR